MIDLGRVFRLVRRYNGAGWFLPIGVALFAGSLVPSLHNLGTQYGGLPARPYDALAVVAVALQCVPLFACRRWPSACLAIVTLGFALDQLRGYHTFAGSALALAVLNAGSRAERGRLAAAIGFSLAYVPFALVFRLLGAGEPPADAVVFYLVMVVAWGIGGWLRSSRRAEAERRRRDAEDTRAAERTRIARELHDVVTHHVTAMLVQTEAARYLTAEPERLDRTLAAVSDTGRQAITDLRQLLDVLDPGHGAEPAGLRALVEQTRRAGQQVEFTEQGTPAKASGDARPVAYRVVQEALTNALKHARGSRTSVQVSHGDSEIIVEVHTDSAAPAGAGGSGRGLAGLRARVEGAGGDFSAGRGAGGGFYVRAQIPVGSAS